MKSEFSLAPIYRIIKRAGVERVNEDAIKALAIILEEIGIKIAKEALEHASQTGKKIVKTIDIEFAKRKILKEET